jgi:hypothetical protein
MSTKDAAAAKAGGAETAAAAAVEEGPSPADLRRDAIRHGLARVRGNVSTARRRLDLHALADAVNELIDLLDPGTGE